MPQAANPSAAGRETKHKALRSTKIHWPMRREIEPCFCEGKLTTDLPKNEGVRLSPNPICAGRAAFAAQSRRRATPVLPEVGGGAHSPRGTWRQWRRRIFFWIPPCWRRPEPMAWPVGLRSDPLFSRAVNYGAPCPIIFRPFLAPNAHRKPRHCSPPVLRLAADLATPLARSRSMR